MISLRDVTMRYPIPKRYREHLLHPLRPRRLRLALSQIDLEIREGDRVALLGPNGAGKTTLLKLIGGLLYPSEGRASVDGVDADRGNRAICAKIGFVINEERSFYWRLTGVENLEFFGVLDNIPTKILRERIEDLLGLVGLGGAGAKRVSDYSSGMRQRLAIARGLLPDPEVLLLDEPTKSLDPLGAVELRRLIATDIHTARKRTLVVATNSIPDVTSLCDRVFLINHGREVGSLTVANRSDADVAEFYRSRIQDT